MSGKATFNWTLCHKTCYHAESEAFIQSKSRPQQHSSWVFDSFFQFYQECCGFTTIYQPMVVRQRNIHHRADFNLKINDLSYLSIHRNWAVFNSMHTQNSTLRHVNYWSSHHTPKHPSIADGKCSAHHVF